MARRKSKSVSKKRRASAATGGRLASAAAGGRLASAAAGGRLASAENKQSQHVRIQFVGIPMPSQPPPPPPQFIKPAHIFGTERPFFGAMTSQATPIPQTSREKQPVHPRIPNSVSRTMETQTEMLASRPPAAAHGTDNVSRTMETQTEMVANDIKRMELKDLTKIELVERLLGSGFEPDNFGYTVASLKKERNDRLISLLINNSPYTS